MTRVLVVRDGAERVLRSVRASDEPSRFATRVGLWSAIGAGSVAFLWLTGHFGESLGFARVLGLPDLVSSTDHGLASGVRMVLAVPMRIFEMALVDPMRLAAAFVLVSLPAAGLSVSKPRVPGGPKVSRLANTFAVLGLVTACVVFTILIAWVAWPGRTTTLDLAPTDRAAFGVWLDDATATAGFDAFSLVASVLWLVLLFRLPLPRVAIAFAAVAGFVATFATWTGFATSNGIVDACRLQRPVIITLSTTDTSDARNLMLGTIHAKTAVLSAGSPPTTMVLPAPEFVVTGRSSLAQWMLEVQ